MCKRYSVDARRKGETEFTSWSDTNDINRVIEFVDKIRELGFEARITEPGIEQLEKKIEDGYLVELPCRVGDTVYMPWVYGGESDVAILTVTHVIIDKIHSYIRTNLKSDNKEFLLKYNFGRFDFKDFGKRVFRSQKEAEKVLEGSADESITVT